MVTPISFQSMNSLPFAKGLQNQHSQELGNNGQCPMSKNSGLLGSQGNTSNTGFNSNELQGLLKALTSQIKGPDASTLQTLLGSGLPDNNNIPSFGGGLPGLNGQAPPFGIQSPLGPQGLIG